MHSSTIIGYKVLWRFLVFTILLNINSIAQPHDSSLQKLSQDAEVIFIGKVVKSQSMWNSDKSQIYTNVTLSVDEYLKGKSTEKNITVTHPGGEVDGVGELYSHHPQFSNDEEVLMFVKANSDNILTVVEGEKGKMLINSRRDDAEKLVGQNQKLNTIKSQIKNLVMEK